MLDLLRQARDAGLESVIVNDGSTPAYTQRFLKAKAYGTVLSHSENLGKGRALKTGLSYIYEHYGASCMEMCPQEAASATPYQDCPIPSLPD
ncbi:MAG TPA: glycosyltransferase [Candidatus Caccomorpha excrementavium]|nr:glycosyltransferase [Candidatus Caccomorpha excrementavium]